MKIKRLLVSIIALLLVLGLVACNINVGSSDSKNNGNSGGNSSGSGDGAGGDGDFSDGDRGEGSPPPTGGVDSGSGGEGSGENGGQHRPEPGQLTAGEWSDIKNYDFYLNLFNIINDPDTEESQRRRTYVQFINYFGFETRFMLTVNVDCNELPVGDAVVELYGSAQDKLFAAKTDVRGNAYLFPSYNLNNENISVKVRSGAYESNRSLVYTGEDLRKLV